MDNTYSSLIADSLRLHVDRNEKLHKMRSGLHVEAMKMIQELTMLEKEEPPCGSSNLEQRGMLQLLNYLIVDYFNWHGFTNTMKTFALETGEKSRPKPRDKLQQELKGKFIHEHLPILLQMVLKESNKADDALLEKSLWQNIPIKVDQGPKKLKKAQGRLRATKDLSTKEKPNKKVKRDVHGDDDDSDIPDEGKLSNNRERRPKKNNAPAKEIRGEANTANTMIKEHQPKKISNSAKNLQKFSKALKSFPNMKSFTHLKSFNESKMKLQPTHEAPKKRENSKGPTPRTKEKPVKSLSQNIETSRGSCPSILQTNSKTLPIRVDQWKKEIYSKESPNRLENLKKSYLAFKDMRVKGLPTNPINIHETSAAIDTTKNKVNVRQRMVESNVQHSKVPF